MVRSRQCWGSFRGVAISILACAFLLRADDITVHGRVLDVATGGGIPGARVRVAGPDAAERGKFTDLTLTTDASGGFEAAIPARGSLVCSVQAEGYIPLERFAGCERDGASLDFRMTRPAGAAGSVVDTDTGKPLAQFEVRAREAYWFQGRRELMNSGSFSTKADGTFLFSDLTPGDYVFEIRPPAPIAGQTGSTRGYARVFWPGGASQDTASPIPVAAGTVLNVGEVRITQQEWPTVSVLAGGACAEGQPLEVSLNEQRGRSFTSVRIWRGACGKTTVLPHVSPGKYVLRVEPPGRNIASPTSTASIHVTDRDLVVEVALAVPAPAAGQIIVKGWEKGRPIPSGIQLKLWPRGSSDSAILSPVLSADAAKVKADGSFESTLVWPPGGEVVAYLFSAPDNLYVQSVRYNGVEYDGPVFVMNRYAPRHEVTVICSDQAASLAGVAKAPDKQPAAKSTVLITPWPPTMLGTYPAGVEEKQAGMDGTFRFIRLPPGNYRVIAVAAKDRPSLEEPGKMMSAFSSTESIELRERQAAVSNPTVISVR